ncbi:hypothetical protein CYPRO_3169 [Cyclonatronum proteinivorum]|uniref:Uncharacterized protein n=1 Tax=Cyclonatronum proteinivorum TaxID=1457365 RepID=A0A345UPK1_9BACT|nr:hypothetical protein CYPRO_3169 [Cyclonatronum proteinivorum]
MQEVTQMTFMLSLFPQKNDGMLIGLAACCRFEKLWQAEKNGLIIYNYNIYI